MAQRKRTSKTSNAQRRSSLGVRLTEVQKVLIGHGQIDAYEPAEAKTPWRGVGDLRGKPFDAAQAAENKRTMPSLFNDQRRGQR